MSNLMGLQARYILETTFDTVANGDVTCVVDANTSIDFKAIIHDEVVRARREHLSIPNDEGMLDQQSKRVILLTRDILASGLTSVSPSSHFLIKGKRFDFSVNEPFCDVSTTPFMDADEVFSVFYMRQAQELESSISPVEGGTGEFSFNSWVLDNG
jgi:hypothetical protein